MVDWSKFCATIETTKSWTFNEGGGGRRGQQQDVATGCSFRWQSSFALLTRSCCCWWQDRLGFRSYTADNRFLQANKRSELVFTNHSFEAWEGWLVEGADLEACRLVHGKLRSLSLQVAIEVLAAPQDDGVVTRWLG
eukprot:SM000078S22121  [mRNA]  locus=s78:599992:600635:+ [translate_table: standard]